MPANNTFNETYFEQALNIVNDAATGGIYSLLDAHQDSFSDRYCGEVRLCVLLISSRPVSIRVHIM